MPRNADLLTIYRVAQYYYRLGLTQQQIAERENISRSQVSRLLLKAQQLSIVKIELSLPEELDAGELELALMRELKLRRVIIAPVPYDAAKDDRARTVAVARAAVEHLPALIRDCQYVGVGWGRTVYETSLRLQRQRDGKPVCFVPLLGTSGDDNPSLQVNAITDRFCERFGSGAIYTNLSTIREPAVELSRTDLERLSGLRKHWESLDAAIVGLGGPPGSSNGLMSEFSNDYLDILRGSGCCADILAQYFFEDGRVLDYSDRYILTAYDIHSLKRLKNVICLTGGSEKPQGILAAALSGYIKTLITDYVTARTLLESL